MYLGLNANRILIRRKPIVLKIYHDVTLLDSFFYFCLIRTTTLSLFQFSPHKTLRNIILLALLLVHAEAILCQILY